MGGASSHSRNTLLVPVGNEELVLEKNAEEGDATDDIKIEPRSSISLSDDTTKSTTSDVAKDDRISATACGRNNVKKMQPIEGNTNDTSEKHTDDEDDAILAHKLAQEMADAELAESIANEMMDEEYALKLAAEYEGVNSLSPALQSQVDIKLQQQNDEVYAQKMRDIFELEENDTDMCHSEIQRIRDLSVRAEIQSKANTEFILLERARATFQQQQKIVAGEAEAEADAKSICLSKKKKRESDEFVLLSPNLTLSKHQQDFFRHYGFVVIRKVIQPETIASAKKAANAPLEKDAQNDTSLESNTKSLKVFANLPEGFRPEWANCQDQDLRSLFSDERNMSLCHGLVGDFDFDAHNTVGSYSFAPRFRAWDLHPPQSTQSKKSLSHALRTVCPSYSYDLNDLPSDFDTWSKQFLLSAQGLGMKFSPCEFENWHVDGWDVMNIAGFDLIWGTFLSPLQRGNLGNLIVYPGSHYCISQFLREKGARNSVWYDSRKDEQPLASLPSLYSAGVADGRPYEVLAKEGDVILMHPFLAHGVGTNVSLTPRLAVYCRLQAKTHAEYRRKMHTTGGDLLGARTWTGDIFSLQPGLS
jgi:hypothetical protein